MRIIVADDHPLYLEAARLEVGRAFPQASIETAGTLDETLGLLAGGEAVSFILADYSMPGMDGASGIARLVQAAGGSPVVVMSGVAAHKDVQACLAAGVRGFLPKTLDPGMFGSILTIIAAGGSYVPVEFSGSLPQPEGKGGRVRSDDFSEREVDILRMVVDGLSNKEIARKLNCQEVTVKVNLTRVFGKLGAKNRTQAAIIAVEQALIAKG